MCEPLLEKPHNRYDFFRVEARFEPVRKFAEKLEKATWHPEEIDTSKDYSDYKTLKSEEKLLLENTLAFFASSDGILFENCEEEIHDIQWPDFRKFYIIKARNEIVHAESYGIQIETLIAEEKRKTELFDSIFHIPIIQKKAKWAEENLSKDKPLAHRLLASICVEGIFFSSSFATISWFRHAYPGKLDGICNYNDMIMRDENLHVDFSAFVYNNYIVNKYSTEAALALFEEAVKIEEEFARESLPKAMLGLNRELMCDHIRSIANGRLKELGYVPLSKVEKTPLTFMENVVVQPKKNFFETRVTEYQKNTGHKGDLSADVDTVDF
jgi:ribonucleotide reductase beta subunit family protein with ferritin-like domain